MQKIKVWDLPTRLFHWSLVAGVLFMWMSASRGGEWMAWHLRVGLAMTVLIMFRIVWGFVGSETSRFAQFVRPTMIFRYLRRELSVNEQPGHNPLGALMVVALIAAVSFQAVTGLFAADVNAYLYDGYLSFLIGEAGERVRTVHVLFFNVLALLAAVHIVTVILYKVVFKTNLITPMFTGCKTMDEPLPRLRFVSPLRALAIVVLLSFVAYGISLAG